MTLRELVRDGTFRARQHDGSLSEELVADKRLRSIQRAWKEASDANVRRALAFNFEKAVRESAGSERLEFKEKWYAQSGPWWIPSYMLEDGQCANSDRLQDEWDEWNAKYGPRWRAEHDCRSHDDPEVDLDNEEDVDIPDPPLFDRIRRQEQPTLGRIDPP